MNTKLLSVIIPSFNEQDNIPVTYSVIDKILTEANINYEIIFVDDGSKDNTFPNICALHEEHENVHGVSFSRNFGKEPAIFAGLKEAKGDCAVVIDCDLQHPAEVIPTLYHNWEEGYEIVAGVKNSRGKESPFYKLMANSFNSIIKHFCKIDLADSSDFVLMDRVVIDSLLDMPERSPFFRGLSRWVGFKILKVPFDVKEREIGESKWSGSGLFRYAIHNITIFSAEPLQIVTTFGIIFVIGSIFLGAETLFRYFEGTALGGFTTVITLILLSSGLIMISLGIIGLYLAQIYDEVKNRPRYIVSKKV